MPILSVEKLQTQLATSEGLITPVDEVSLSLKRGETLGVVGESGSGKSMLALSLMRLIPNPPGRIVGGKVLYRHDEADDPIDFLKLSDEGMRKRRGKNIAMIFQEPMTSLNPLYTIGDQIGEALAIHDGKDRSSIRGRTLELIDLVGIPDPKHRIDAYPHELSGGMRQRAMIAMALSCNPDILIADEPTTALDVTIQAQILELMQRLQRELHMAMMFITHDFGVVAEIADRVMVMYAGQVVESGTTKEIFSNPKHPYTQALLSAVPVLEVRPDRMKLTTIPGTVPPLSKLPQGCHFQDRCPKVQQKCRKEEVPEDPCGIGRLVRCFYAR
ncbi:MAG: ABC transporter ATP-binding protein [Deltaproteobacteria bacterium]|nr:ABC transporter ATP-binding protein [Deltaproteobacteria bacterium]